MSVWHELLFRLSNCRECFVTLCKHFLVLFFCHRSVGSRYIYSFDWCCNNEIIVYQINICDFLLSQCVCSTKLILEVISIKQCQANEGNLNKNLFQLQIVWTARKISLRYIHWTINTSSLSSWMIQLNWQSFDLIFGTA
jgi:hypothetical protein